MLLLMKFTPSPEASVGINRADHSDAQQPAVIGHLEVISRATATRTACRERPSAALPGQVLCALAMIR